MLSVEGPGTVKHRVLVVDDEPALADGVAAALRYEGYEVAEAATGKQALALLMSFEPQLIVLDWMLPDLDGIEVSRSVRRYRSSTETAILFLTARGSTDDMVRALSCGGDDYLSKPFSLEELLARVESLLRRTGASSVPRGERAPR
jgi:two-component system OmpR family response regulator